MSGARLSRDLWRGRFVDHDYFTYGFPEHLWHSLGTIDNLLYPIFVGKRILLHILPVFVVLLGGLTIFGASGLILGPVALAVTAALLDIWRRRIADRQAAEVSVELVK